MAEKKKFLLRIDADTHAALERWAADDLRSVNGQIEFLLVEALRRAGRLRRRAGPEPGAGPEDEPPAVTPGPDPRRGA